MKPADVEGGVAYYGHVLVCMPFSDAVLILTEYHVQDPMDLVLHAPMLAHPCVELLGRPLGTGDIETDLLGWFLACGKILAA